MKKNPTFIFSKNIFQFRKWDFWKRASLSAMVFCLLALNAMAQPTLSNSFSPNTIGPGSTTTITFTITNNTGAPVTDLAFTDILPTAPGNIVIATPAMASTTCSDGVVTAPDGGGTVTLSDGRLGNGQTCFVTVNVTGSTSGAHTNPAVTLTSSAGSSMSLPVNLTISTDRPSFSKNFSPSSLDLGEVSTLTFTIDNTANSNNLSSLVFTDNLPVGMVIATPAIASHTCGGPNPTLTASSGSSQISFSSFGISFPGFEVLLAGESCAITVDVVSTNTGTLENITTNLTSNTGSSGYAVDALEVSKGNPIHISKKFLNPNPAPPGGTVDLEFTITNYDRDFSATDITFTDDLDAALGGMVPVLPLPTNPCGSGSSLSGSSLLTLIDGELSPNGEECTFTVTCQVPSNAAAGTYTNTTSIVSGTVNGSTVNGNEADAKLFIEATPLITKEFTDDPVLPGSTVDLEFTITNPSTTDAMTDIAFDDILTENFGLPFPVNVTLPAAGSACGGNLTLTSCNTNCQQLSLTGGTLAAESNCSFTATITIPVDMAGGIYPNVTSAPTATLAGNTVTGSLATDDLIVLSVPTISKAFTTDPVAAGDPVDMEITFTLSENAATDATDLAFTDDLDAALSGMTLTSVVSNTCGGTVTGIGTGMLGYTGGTVTAGSSCSMVVTLQTPADAATGTHTNTTSAVTATVAGQTVTGSTATDDLIINPITFSKSFLDDTLIPGQATTLTFTIENAHPTDAATNAIFTDNLQAEVSGFTATGPATSDDCGGTLSGTTFLTYIGGSVPSGGSCTIEVPVMVPAGAANGSYQNITSGLFTDLGTTDPATAPFSVNNALIEFSKEFTNDPVIPGNTVDLEFTLTNLDDAHQVDNITFSDDLAAVLADLEVSGPFPSDPCGAGSSLSGTTNITLTGGTLAAGADCTFTVTLQTDANSPVGVYTNTTSAVRGDVSGTAVTGNAATDDLKIQGTIFTKTFAPNAIDANGTTTLTFYIENLDASNALSGFQFTDNLDDMLSGAVAVAPLPTDPCGTGSSISGTSLLTFTGGELPPSGNCSFDITVMVPCATATGNYINTSSDLTVGGLSVGNPDTAALMVTAVAAVPTFTKPADITIYMDGSCSYDASVSETGDVTDEFHPCCTGLEATFTDNLMLSGCSGTGTIQRIWQLTDCFSNAAPNQTQTITVADTTRPTVVCPVMVDIACTDSSDPMVNGSLGMATGMDNCNMGVTASYTDTDNQTSNGTCSDYEYTITRTWKATDACGNESFTCEQIINVKDDMDPNVACLSTLTVQLDINNEYTLMGSEVLDLNNSSDNCGGSVTPVSVTPNEFDCEDLDNPIMVTLTAQDACGRQSTCSSTITVDDTDNPCCPSTNIMYVDKDTPNDFNGDDWDNAYASLQDALEKAKTCPLVTEIWVADGTYYTDDGGLQTSGDRNASFAMLDGIAIYGGFNGTEATLGQRDLQNYPTVLDGNIGNVEDSSDNSYHVINNKGTGATSSAILDGFIITGGNADSVGDDEKGGGILNEDASPSISNCLFTNNSADYCGGAIFNKNSSSTIDSCVFIYNNAEIGGAIHNGSDVAANIHYSHFEHNSALEHGGAIFNNTAILTGIINCYFFENTAGNLGGAVYNLESSPDIINGGFLANAADEGSAIANQSNSSPNVINCTMHANVAGANGGAIRNLTGTAPLITNCILWGNGTEIVNAVPGATVSYSIVEQATGVYPGTNNKNEDPVFASSTSLQLAGCSGAIGMGLNSANGTTTDLAGNARTVGVIDLGAYEYDGPIGGGTITWSGDGDGSLWSDADNWDLDIEPSRCHDVVIPTGNNVLIPAAYTALGKTLLVENGAELTTDPTAEMDIKD